jgi:hypothetical protein
MIIMMMINNNNNPVACIMGFMKIKDYINCAGNILHCSTLSLRVDRATTSYMTQ